MMRMVLFVLCLLIPGALAASTDSQSKVRPITDAETILAVYTERWSLLHFGKSELIFAAWPDGHVVWSRDPINGGAPYFVADVPPSKVTELVTRLKRRGIFSDARLKEAYFAVDSDYTTLLLQSGKKHVEMQSWHEIYNSAGGFEDEAGFRHFRKVWDRTRAALVALLPADGTKIDGELLRRQGVASWKEQ